MTDARNRLAAATSPYLQQHAHNPVDWWPWCEEALQLARDTDRPILLSVGYSACHWCHVMAHESFEDPATAALMNRLFVNIKVDREERPDLDKIYQSAHQLLSGHAGGWPLTVFLTPDDQVPFFAGTYFPREPRHGLPSFGQLLRGVERAYREQAGEIREQNRSLLQALGSAEQSGAPDEDLGLRPLAAALGQLERSYDATHGGFGNAPKFPHATALELVLRNNGPGPASDRGQPLDMATHTLRRMALGGIFDQLGGGFCRYSVDDLWMIPHFEKMLYDNGPLLALYSDAWLATGESLFRRTAAATANWVIREMQSPRGGYYSTLDADSEGHEGKFYVWDRAEVRSLLRDEQYRLLARRYGLDRPANFEGRWHLHTYVDPQDLAPEAETPIEEARRTLLAARERRVRPGRDEKILTAWNALMIKGMARAARIFGEPAWLSSAEQALRFLREQLWGDGRLLATHKDGRSHLDAYLDDYAFLLDALIELLQTRWRSEDLALAQELAEVLLIHFEDPDAGGFFFTADDHERLIHRPKPFGDDSTPSGNGIAAQALQRLGYLLGETRYLAAAEHTLRCSWEAIGQLPYAHPSLLIALQEHLDPPEILILRGEATEIEGWRAMAAQRFAPQRLIFTIPADAAGLPEAIAAKAPQGRAVAYLCRGNVCAAPLTDVAKLSAALQPSPDSGPG